MPYLDTGTMKLPFGGAMPRSRRTSLQGARVAIVRAGSQYSRMLARYLACGPQTDGEMALVLGLPEGRISARRSELVARGFVAYLDDVMGPYGAECNRYELTVRGQNVAAKVAAL